MRNENTRNTIAFIVITVVFLLGYQALVLGPQAEKRRAQTAEARQEQVVDAVETGAASDAPGGVITDRAQALGQGGVARVPIETPRLKGSLSLLGARIDDLFLLDYRERVDADAPPVELFRPQGMEHAYFAQFGWTGGRQGDAPGPNTVWRLTAGSKLTPSTPITLTWDNGQGLRFTRVVSIDDQYMFTVTDTVANLGEQAVTLRPYGRVERMGVPETLGREMISHEGAIGTFSKGSGYVTEQIKYNDWTKKPRQDRETTGGWLGVTDKYWFAALIPGQDDTVDASFRVREQNGVQVHEASLRGAETTIAAGAQATETLRLYAGAKRNEILSAYEKELGLPRFIYAIDWGFLFFLTRPIFLVLEFFYGWLGNFGLAILALTVVTKIVLFPLANKSYESLSKMRTLQPKMEEIKKKFPDDPQKQQQETLALYQREKINPLAGCLPILVQIPIFYALYKVLFVTIEMRHAPFFGWIRDLSARDPSNIWNLFGLLPWDPAAAPLIGGLLGGSTGGFTLGLSILAIIYGLTMWLQMAMNPPAPDPMQRRIFAMMPFIFTFIMASFAAGLLIYWAWNNVLSIIQQYVIMHRFKAENPIDTFIDRYIRKKKAT